MSSIFERLAAGPGAMQQDDHQEWNQAAGSIPPNQFGQVAYSAMQQVPQQEYYSHTQPGLGGTDPFGSLPQEHRAGVAQSLIGALTGGGMSQQDIMNGSGVRTLDPNQMSSQDVASLSQWTHQNQPQAFAPVAQQYQNQPDVLSSLMGNKGMMLLAAGLGAKYLEDRSRRG